MLNRLAALLLCLAATATLAETPLRVIAFPGPYNLPMWVAEKNGWFAAEGLAVKVSSTPGSVFLVKSLMSGEQDVALVAFDNVVAYDEGQGEVDLGAPADFAAYAGLTRGTLDLYASASIAGVRDLRGKSIGVDAIATGFSYALQAMLAKEGLREGDYALESIGGTAVRAKALLEDKTPATLLTVPFTLTAKAKGFHRIANVVDSLGPYQSGTIVARRSWAAAHRDTLVKFTRATVKAIDWILAPGNRAAVVAIYRENQKDASEAFASAVIDSLVSEKDGFAPHGALDTAGMATVLRIRSEYGRPRKEVNDAARYVDESVLADALR